MTASLTQLPTAELAKATMCRPLSSRIRTSSWETKLAVCCIAAIALHVLDDNFLQREPGTTAAQHLVSGLIPLTTLIVFAAAYPRMRAGLRAGILIPLGLLGVVAGAGEAGYYSVEVGPSGDDYTGLLALAAGVVLVGLGAATLWTTRRRDGGPARRYVRRLVTAAAAVIAGYVVLLPLALSYVFTHSARAVVPAANPGAPARKGRFSA